MASWLGATCRVALRSRGAGKVRAGILLQSRKYASQSSHGLFQQGNAWIIAAGVGLAGISSYAVCELVGPACLCGFDFVQLSD